MNPAGSRTIQSLLRDAAARLQRAGIERGRVDAEILLAHLLGLRRLDLLAHSEREISENEAAAFDRLLERRASRYPLPYLTGEREFMGLTFAVNEHVLIPRPETETLVEAAIALLRDGGRVTGDEDGPVAEPGQAGETPARTEPSRIPHRASCIAIDVGTGSGCIAVSIARFVPEARVLATDASPGACAVARLNAERLGVADRVSVYEGDLLAPVEHLTGAAVPPAQRAAVVCANLPYIPEEHLKDLQPEVRDWEPAMALGGGPGGLDVIERFLGQVTRHLRPGGHLLLEIGPEAGQADRLSDQLARSGNWRAVRVLRDLAGLPRVVACQCTVE